MSQPSPLYQLIEARLGGTLPDLVAARRPPRKSWREVADEIQERTGIQISDETLRIWFAESDVAA